MADMPDWRVASALCFLVAVVAFSLFGWDGLGKSPTSVMGLRLYDRGTPTTMLRMPQKPEDPAFCNASCPSIPPLKAWKPFSKMHVMTNVQVLWSGNGTSDVKEVMVDEEVKIKIDGDFISLSGMPPNVFAWIRSEAGDILYAELGMPSVGKTQIEGWKVSFKIMDPGRYAIYLFAVTPPPHANPQAPREYRIQALSAKPQQLQVSQLSPDGSVLTSFDASRIPKRHCRLGLDEMRGRWVRSSVVSEASRCLSLGCPRDGWTYVSRTCYWNVFSKADTYRLLEMIEGEVEKPLSLIAAGSSVLRGSLQSLLDALVPDAWQSFAGIKSIPGVGTTVKCWGWLEYEVDRKLHLAFHDWRLPSYEKSDRNWASARILKTLKEDHEIVVIELGFSLHSEQRGFADELESFWSPIFQEVLPTLRGKVILFTGLYSPMNFPVCVQKKCAISWGRVAWVQQSVNKLVASWPNRTREASQGKLLVVDPAPMALAMFFDGETEMGEGMSASQHWHRYEYSQEPGRKVFGTVADVLGQLFVSELLRGRRFQKGSLNLNGPNPQTEKEKKENRTTRACAQCPETSCCPWRPVPLDLNYSLAKVESPPHFDSWAQLPLEGCGRVDSKRDPLEKARRPCEACSGRAQQLRFCSLQAPSGKRMILKTQGLQSSRVAAAESARVQS